MSELLDQVTREFLKSQYGEEALREIEARAEDHRRMFGDDRNAIHGCTLVLVDWCAREIVKLRQGAAVDDGEAQ